MSTGVYQIRNTVTGECYVGSSIKVKTRRSQHACALKAGTHYNSALQSSFNTHGDISFEFEVLEECEPALLAEREAHWIRQTPRLFNVPGERTTRGRVPQVMVEVFARLDTPEVEEFDGYVGGFVPKTSRSAVIAMLIRKFLSEREDGKR